MKKSILIFLSLIFIFLLPAAAVADDNDLIALGGDMSFPEETITLLYGNGYAESDDMILMEDRAGMLGISDQRICNYLKSAVSQIAAGSASDTQIQVPASIFLDKFSFTASELGLSYIYDSDTASWNPQLKDSLQNLFYKQIGYRNIVNALWRDLPYEMYWFDFVSGCSYSLHTGSSMYYDESANSLIIARNQDINTDREAYITFGFRVSADYSAGGKSGTYLTNTSKTRSAAAAVESGAGRIISAAAKMSDYDKIAYYGRAICSLVSYNTGASGASSAGNPWELVYVFDGNTSTNVVCEGYAKAFKYLCDKTAFSGKGISCHIVTGTAGSDSGHMWNIIHMDDGRNYIVDLTNCDGDGPGFPDFLVLSGAKDMGYGIYKVIIPERRKNNTQFSETEITYVYDSDTRDIFKSDELQITGASYRPSDAADNILIINEQVSSSESAEIPIGSTWKIKTSSTEPLVKESDISWSSSNPTVASVDSMGYVSAKAYGKAEIIGRSSDGRHLFRVNVQTRFPDVIYDGGNVYNYIYWAADNDIVRGYKNGNFGPADKCTRAQFVVMLWRMAGRPKDYDDSIAFSDVNSGMSSARAIKWAASEGIIVGYKDGTFRPDNPLTRSQIVVILWRMLGRPSADNDKVRSFADVDAQMSASKAINWASSNSVVGGYSNGNFGPQDNCLRRQIATILYKCVKRGFLAVQ